MKPSAQELVLASCLVLVVSVIMAPLPALASQCSTAGAAGKWAYTYTGTIFTPSGPVPAASVGHFSEDAAGNLTGSQARSVAGTSGTGGHHRDAQREQRLHGHRDDSRVCQWRTTTHSCAGSGI